MKIQKWNDKMKDCIFRVKNSFGQCICTISDIYIGKTKTCQQINEDLCKEIKAKELQNWEEENND